MVPQMTKKYYYLLATYETFGRKMTAEHKFLSRASLICYLQFLLYREERKLQECPDTRFSRTTFTNENTGALFPQPLGKADTGPFYQHRPSHSLVPLRR